MRSCRLFLAILVVASLDLYRKLILITLLTSAPPPSGIFGVPLNVSIKYANVAISLTGEDGKSFVYGYVPIVVAKCGVFLKDKGTLSLLPVC